MKKIAFTLLIDALLIFLLERGNDRGLTLLLVLTVTLFMWGVRIFIFYPYYFKSYFLELLKTFIALLLLLLLTLFLHQHLSHFSFFNLSSYLKNSETWIRETISDNWGSINSLNLSWATGKAFPYIILTALKDILFSLLIIFTAYRISLYFNVFYLPQRGRTESKLLKTLLIFLQATPPSLAFFLIYFLLPQNDNHNSTIFVEFAYHISIYILLTLFLSSYLIKNLSIKLLNEYKEEYNSFITASKRGHNITLLKNKFLLTDYKKKLKKETITFLVVIIATLPLTEVHLDIKGIGTIFYTALLHKQYDIAIFSLLAVGTVSIFLQFFINFTHTVKSGGNS